VIRRLALVGGGALAAAAGLFAPRDAIVAALASDAAGPHLEQLRLGVSIAKALLALHGAWLFAAGARRVVPRVDPVPLWEPPPGAEPGSLGARQACLLAALLALAALLRWTGIHQDLWHDEVFTLLDYARPPLARTLSLYTDDNQHLLYSALAHASLSAFGESAATLRLPAFGFGLASLWATLRLGRLVAGPREAWLAAALLAVSYHHVWFSQNARGYTGLLFATLLSTDLLLRALWRAGWSQWVGYAAAVALGMTLHLSMAFVAAAHGLVLVALLARAGSLSAGRWRGLAALVLAATLSGQAYALVIPQLVAFYLQPAAGATAAAVAWKSPLWLLDELVRRLGVGLALGGLGLVGAGLVFGRGACSYAARSPAVAACFALPALLGGAALVLLQRNLWPRFFFHEVGFAALFAVRGACLAGEWLGARIGRPGPRTGAAVAGALALASALTLPRVYRHPKQDFRGALAWVREQQTPGDRIVGVGMAGEAYHFYYAPEMPLALTLEDLESELAPRGRTWILYTLGSYIEATDPALWAALQTRFEEVRAFPGTLGDGAIRVRRSLEAAAAPEPPR